MEGDRFKEWYDWVKEKVAEFQDISSRVAVINGFFSARPGEKFTGDQVSQMLALRYPESKK